MKRLFSLIACIVLFCAFTCENEPLEGEFVTEDPDVNLFCADATQNTVTAATNFTGVAPDNENYTQLCLAYKSTLEDQIDACGDDGAIQAIIDSLGNCNQDNQSDECEEAIVVTNQAETAYNNDNTNEELCNAYKTALQNKINFCGDSEGNIQAIIDDLGDCFSSTLFLTMGGVDVDFNIIGVVVEDNLIKIDGVSSYFPSHHLLIELNPGEIGTSTFITFELSTGINTFVPYIEGTTYDFQSDIITNSSGLIVGTFGGTVVNSSGGGVDLTNGIIDISY
jgi:hypothetical protein